ncbi:MAG: DUF2357 domain-containing protein [Candidatus Cloacimonetes bacterium]|mgnify:CR=1 FL=1|jgi:predicted component of viral defense system (DUF524 family)|nr:DUF2357 domain-containing protein [Candidatus Cloacimonadota bacterium]
MYYSKYNIEIENNLNQEITLVLFAESKNDKQIWIEDAETASENGEAIVQLMEGCTYEYKLSENYQLGNKSKIVSKSKANKSCGRINTGIFVGTLTLDIIDFKSGIISKVDLEVRSVKTSYREDYRFMLEFIAEKCTDLLMLHTSPVTQSFTPDHELNPETLYQRFAFIKSILDSDEFKQSVNRIISDPVTSWSNIEENIDIRRMSRLNSSHLKQIVSRKNRIILPDSHSLRQNNILKDIPAKITVVQKTETVDTAENRFIKHAMQVFTSFCSDVRSILEHNKGSASRAFKEASKLETQLEEILDHNLFRQISRPRTLPLNSPVLQRKEGYREILRVWLLFDLAAKLIWKGGEDVYKAGKRDIAILYEYWLFFKLIDLLKEIFEISSSSMKNLIVSSDDGLGLKLKSGKKLVLEGVFKNSVRNLEIEFCYNRTFSGNKKYPKGGSWTKSMRPDYTLSFWPEGIKREDAEKQEMIVHIHFDAKYKIDYFEDIVGEDIPDDPEMSGKILNAEKLEQREGTYKRADLLKMHAYKDAIRRTGGAYVLYPGTEQEQPMKGFHEIIPGLGAFTVRPSKDNDGTQFLRDFISKVVLNLRNRISQRERLSYKKYNIHKELDKKYLSDSIIDYEDNRRVSPPSERFVIIGFKNEKHDKLIQNGYYNFRMGSDRGSIPISPKTADADYILLHQHGDLVTNEIYKITRNEPRIFSKSDIEKKGYINPSHEFYLVYDIEKMPSNEFNAKEWDVRKLHGFKAARGSALPFAVSLAELMDV